MNDSISKEIESIKDNLNILPKKTKDNINKYNDYIDDKLVIYHNYLNDIKSEIDKRVSSIKKKYFGNDYVLRDNKLDTLELKVINKYIDNMEKMKLDVYLYQLRHFYNNDLEDINLVINNIFLAFNNCGIELSSSDFIISPAVNTYLVAVLNKKNNLHELFEKLYWENSNIIFQIEINFRYLYFKYEKRISKYYNDLALKYNIDNIMTKYNDDKDYNSKIIHNNSKYIASKIIDGEVNINDFKESNIRNIINNIIIEEDNNTYNNLLKLAEFISIYSKYLKYSFIIEDIKDKYNNISNFKDKYIVLLKEITKDEDKLFNLNKKIENKGLFKLKESKIKELVVVRNNLINDIISKYNELDDSVIYDIILRNIDNQTSYMDILKMVCFNFSYLMKVYKSKNDDITLEEVLSNMEDLVEFVYGSNNDLLGNIFILDEKNIPLIIRDRFRLVNIRVLDEDIEQDNILDFINKINSIIRYYDIKNNNIDLEELEFILKVNSLNSM